MDEKIFYIIVAVIWIVSSIFKAAKGKKQLPKEQEIPDETYENHEVENDLEQVLEDLIMGRKPKVPEPIYEDPPPNDYIENANDYNSLQHKYESLENDFANKDYGLYGYKNKEEGNTKKLVFENIQDNNNQDVINNNTITAENFDLKQAVIYAEIMKRPHY